MQVHAYPGLAFHSCHGGVDRNLNSFVLAKPLESLGNVRILTTGEPRIAFHDRHAASQAAQRLRELKADISAAENQQMLGNHVEFQRLDMCQRKGLSKAGRGVDRRARSSVQKDAISAQDPSASIEQSDLQCPFAD